MAEKHSWVDFDPYACVGPVLRLLPPEAAHRAAICALRHGLVPAAPRVTDAALRVRCFGLDFPNPVGLAAGFDKNGEAVGALLGQGFGAVEVGTVTLRAQAGNPGPRVFRLPADGALINRLGFNNDGVARVGDRLRQLRRHAVSGIIGVNIGPNRDSGDPVAEVATAARELAPLADYLVINVSSPNTPGLRHWQEADRLSAMLGAVVAALRLAAKPPPVLVKIAPDLDDQALPEVVAAATNGGAAGLIATNTTIARPSSLRGRHRHEAGGLSGRPLFARSTHVLARLWQVTDGRLPLVGVGGIASADDAYAKIRAGASVVQLYTALIYAGPALVRRINLGLLHRLRRDGLASVADAVGLDAARVCSDGQAAAAGSE